MPTSRDNNASIKISTPTHIHRTLKVTALFLILTLIALSSLNLPAWAQEPAPFEISIVSAANQVIAGQPFTYTITITNVSQSPQQNVLVTIDTPAGTTYNDSSVRAEQRWLIGGFSPDQPGTITWITQETMPPDGTTVISLVVNVLPTTTGEIVNEDYFVTILNNYQAAMVKGPPIKTQVLIPTPTPTATSPPTATAAPTHTATPPPATAVATVTPTELSQSSTAVSLTPIAPETAPQETLSEVWWIVGLVTLGLVVGLGWILLKKQ